MNAMPNAGSGLATDNQELMALHDGSAVRGPVSHSDDRLLSHLTLPFYHRFAVPFLIARPWRSLLQPALAGECPSWGCNIANVNF